MSKLQKAGVGLYFLGLADLLIALLARNVILAIMGAAFYSAGSRWMIHGVR